MQATGQASMQCSSFVQVSVMNIGHGSSPRQKERPLCQQGLSGATFVFKDLWNLEGTRTPMAWVMWRTLRPFTPHFPS
jgi:hypothetical protein